MRKAKREFSGDGIKLVPVFHQNHWFLMVVRSHLHSIEIFDSIPQGAVDIYLEMATKVMQVLGALMDRPSSYLMCDVRRILCARQIPLSRDCGAYVCLFSKLVSFGITPTPEYFVDTWKQSSMRQGIFWELRHGQLMGCNVKQ